MIAEDCWWGVDVGLSSPATPGLDRSTIGFTLLPHWSRIVYESHRYLSMHDPNSAQTLTLQYGPQIEAARHSVKLFDDTHRGFEGLVSWFDHDLAEAHKAAFIDQVRPRWARRFAKDLGLIFLDGHLVTTTHLATFQSGADLALVGDPAAMSQALDRAAFEIGQVLRAITDGLYGLNDALPDPTLDLTKIGNFSTRDCRSDDYLSRRFDPILPSGVKNALTAIETMTNTVDLIAEKTVPGHEATVFRMRLIVVMHSLSALKEIQAQFHAGSKSTGMANVDSLLKDPVAVLLASQGARRLRNIAMHYGIDDTTPGLNPQLAMFGLVELYLPNTTFVSLGNELRRIAHEIGDLLANWLPGSSVA